MKSLLRFFGLVLLSEHRAKICAKDQTIDQLNAELVRVKDRPISGVVTRIGYRDSLAPAERALIERVRLSLAACVEPEPWTKEELTLLRTFETGPAGVKFKALLRHYANTAREACDSAPIGGEVRAMAEAAGFARASAVIENLSAMLAAHDEQHDERDPAGASAVN